MLILSLVSRMAKEPILETDRLMLRPVTLDDADAVFAWTSDPRVSKFMSYTTSKDITETINWITSTFNDETEWNWVFILKSENRVIGAGSIAADKFLQGHWGIGYNLHYDYWYKGYCTEAMKAIIDFAHRQLGVNKICSEHAVDNPRSGKVMEKCGLTFHHFGEYSKLDGSETFKVKFYTMEFNE